jgi:ribonuclease H2 subunit C
LPLPENYTGAILHVTDKQLPPQRKQQQHVDGEEDEEAEEESMPVDVAIAEQVGEFEEVVIWGHGGEVDASQDMFIRGVTEWVGFAESMHCDGSDCDKGGEEKSGK